MWQVLGNDNCGCPCREYSVVKCDVEWVDHCYQHHYQTKCEKRQAFKPRMVSEPSKLNVTYFKAIGNQSIIISS